ncbi:hypothetical protein EVC29_029 [Rhizobium phage RHph_Y52]|nr:hypothetical protein EVC16_029 [Rhizobium phage RHph_Y21]QIG76730.1 hypothetical protein EVC29_029 [Rhizobium phage RHph_Y52]
MFKLPILRCDHCNAPFGDTVRAASFEISPGESRIALALCHECYDHFGAERLSRIGKWQTHAINPPHEGAPSCISLN